MAVAPESERISAFELKRQKYRRQITKGEEIHFPLDFLWLRNFKLKKMISLEMNNVK